MKYVITPKAKPNSITDIIDAVKKLAGHPNTHLRLLPDYYGYYWLHTFRDGINSETPLKTPIDNPEVAMTFLEILSSYVNTDREAKAVISNDHSKAVVTDNDIADHPHIFRLNKQ